MTQYIVKSGDSISKIALAFYGTYNSIGNWDPIKAIAAASGISNVNVISPGQTLIIPDKPGSAPAVVPGTSVASTSVSRGSTATTPKPIAQDQKPVPPPGTGMSNTTKTILTVLVAAALAAGAAVGYKKYKAHKAKTKPAKPA